MTPPHIAAIIPAFNEEATIARAVAEVRAANLCDEIIVVDDGSTDATAIRAQEAGVRVIRQENLGKGAALSAGVAATDAQILLFTDADVLGLTPAYIRALVHPVVTTRASMVIGIRARQRIVDTFTQRILPKLSGMRALRREVFEAIAPRDLRNFRIETALNYAAHRCGPTRTVMLHGLTHLTKEEKRGFAVGFWGRIRMIGEIVHVHLTLLVG